MIQSHVEASTRSSTTGKVRVQHCTRNCARSARTPSTCSLLGEDLECTHAHCTHTMQDAGCEMRAKSKLLLESSFIVRHDMMCRYILVPGL